jgi:hypothetical protein
MHGPQYHTDFWTGNASPDDQEISDTLDMALTLWQYFNTDADLLTWDGGVTDLVVEGVQLVGAVDGEDRDATFAFDEQDIGH